MHKILVVSIFLFYFSNLHAGEITIQSTTSTKNSGFYEYILPIIQSDLGLDVKVVAVGTGQAIENSKRCDGDLLLVHDTSSELDFIEAGYGVARHDVMYNDFVIVGPKSDELDLKNEQDIIVALKKIFDYKKTFLSRADDSGTHKKERTLWTFSNLQPVQHSGDWYLETGLGMGSTLNIAAHKNAYTITDRATWISFKNKSDLTILFEGHPMLFNQYGIILVNKNFCPNVNLEDANAFVNWILSEKGQDAIETFQVENEQLFFRNN